MTKFVLQAASTCATIVRTGPLGIHEALELVDTVLAPNRWAVRIQPAGTTVDLDTAERIFRAADQPRPVPYADLFTDLRDAVFTRHGENGDEGYGDGRDDDRAAEIVAYVEAHRPLEMFQGDEACLLGECDHPDIPEKDRCAELTPMDPICLGCSAMHDTNTEWGPEWVRALRVLWPCAPISNAIRHYNVAFTTPDGGSDG